EFKVEFRPFLRYPYLVPERKGSRVVSDPVEPTVHKPVPIKILIVDDDAASGALVTRLLENAGYEVEHAAAPVKALPHLLDDEHDLILLDQNMPHMDGLTLLSKIRKTSDVPVVMLTGSDKASLAVEAMRLGAFDYLPKPVDQARLLETVRQALASE